MAYNPVAKHNYHRAATFTDKSKEVDDSEIEEGIEEYLLENEEATASKEDD